MTSVVSQVSAIEPRIVAQLSGAIQCIVEGHVVAMNVHECRLPRRVRSRGGTVDHLSQRLRGDGRIRQDRKVALRV